MTLRCVYHPGFDTDRLAELGLFAKKGEQSRTSPVPMKLILVDSHTRSYRRCAPTPRDMSSAPPSCGTRFWSRPCSGSSRRCGTPPCRS